MYRVKDFLAPSTTPTSLTTSVTSISTSELNSPPGLSSPSSNAVSNPEGGNSKQSNSEAENSGNLLCVVCGDVSSGKHYGILACNGCSGFFKRSVRRRLIYRCQAGSGSCIIDKAHRNQCQACRLKKCLQKGMNKDAVQNERQPRNSATLRPENLSSLRTENIMREAVGVFGLPFKMENFPSSPSECSKFSTNSFWQFDPATSGYVKRSGKLDLDAEDQIPGTSSVAASAGSSAHAPNSSSHSSASIFNPFLNTVEGQNQESNHEISARLLFMAVKWTKNLTSFARLPFRDQVTLLEESWSELFVLCAIQWSFSMERPSLFSTECFAVVSQESTLTLRHLALLFDRFKSLHINPAEFACMKAIVLFKPETNGLKDKMQVENLQDQALLMLKNHIETNSPSNQTRFGRLLMLLANIRMGISDRVEKTFFENIIGNAKMEKLLCDMFQN